MNMPLIVIKVIIVGTVLLACASDTHNRPTKTVHSFPSSETVSRGTTTPSLVLEEVTVKIEISTKATEYIRSGVIVGNGHFAWFQSILIFTSEVAQIWCNMR